MALSARLKRLLKSSPSTAELAAYLESEGETTTDTPDDPVDPDPVDPDPDPVDPWVILGIKIFLNLFYFFYRKKGRQQWL